jgi:O-antigen ligase
MSRKDSLNQFIKFSGLALLIGVTLWGYTSYKTGGMITNRYTNKNTQGIEKQDISTGRVKIFLNEFKAFLDNPFFGIGVGGGKFYRDKTMNNKVASHNEVSRLLGEHGMIGIIVLILLISIPTMHILNQPYLARAFLGAFLLFWFLTINHSAMRIAFPAFIYGLSVVTITFKDPEEISNTPINN